MLISLVERFQEKGEPEIDRYGNWSAALHRFASDCQEGDVPAIRDLDKYLDPIPKPQRYDALCDLIAAHIEFSWTTGKGPLLTDYLKELTELGSIDDLPGDLIEDEFLARYQRPHGDFPKIRDYEANFPGRPDVLELLQKHFFDGGRYTKLHQIGVGATSVVWEGFDHQNGEAVAIKILLPALNDFRAFTREVKITSQLEHIGIVRMVEGGSGPGETPFYIMPLAGGENLSERIQKHHQELTERKKSAGNRHDWEILLQSVVNVCDAIEYAHGHKVLHCDLKPGNVICDENSKIGVIDWGMARRIGTVDKPSAEVERNPVGTPDYMPPEQADGIAEVRSDVFGLGAIIYEALTGRTPYSWVENGMEARPSDWVDQVRAGAFPAPRKLNRKIPRRLDKICMKAMALKLDDRFQTASELAGALRGYINNDGLKCRLFPWKTR